MIDPTAIPQELRQLPSWVVWRSVQRNSGEKPTKIPACVDGTAGKSDDPETWSSFEAAMEALPKFDGLGFVFSEDDGMVGVDLDDCLDEDKKLKPWAVPIAEAFSDTYGEISPSGTGIKFWMRSERLPVPDNKTGGRQFVDANGNPVKDKSESVGAVEMYQSRRFFAVTGDRWGQASTVKDKTGAAHALYRKIFEKPRQMPPAPPTPPSISNFALNGPMPPVERCIRYIDTKPDAVSGNKGHDRCFNVACECFRFGLSRSEAETVMQWFSNTKSQPPWTSREIEHKLDDAYGKVSGSGEFGIRLNGSGHGSQPVAIPPMKPAEEPFPPSFRFYTASEFDALDLKREYHIPDVLAAGPVPTVMAGSFKSLKTSIAMDLFLSLATGSRFLDHFNVTTSINVGLMSGESGGYALQDLARRIIRQKGVTMASVGEQFRICCAVPSLSDQQQMETIERIISEFELKVIGIDPTYLAMRGLKADDAGNVFSMGKFLEPLARLGERTGCTPIIIHHNSRGASRARENEPAELADVAWSGFAEWAGQWLLLARREKYDPDSNGEHALWMTAGGRDGHSTLVGVNVTEGRQNDPGGRRWEVEVEQANKARQEIFAAQQEQKDKNKQMVLDKDRELILSLFVTRYKEGETKTTIRDSSGLNTSRFGVAFARLLQEGKIVPCSVTKGNGQVYEGFCLTPPNPFKSTPEEHSIFDHPDTRTHSDSTRTFDESE